MDNEWARDYQWRTPHTGYYEDLQAGTETFSYGIKELYYLDAIETKTHKAFFVKSMRRDGKGVTSRLEGGSGPRKFEVMMLDHSNTFEYSVSQLVQ